MARRIPTNIVIVDPNNARMRVNVGDERRWLTGPIEGTFRLWVLPIALGVVILALAAFLIFSPRGRSSATPPTPTTVPTTPAAAASKPAVPRPSSPVTVTVPGLAEAAAALKAAADRLAAQQLATPSRLELSGEVGVSVRRENTPLIPPPAQQLSPQDRDEAWARWLERRGP